MRETRGAVLTGLGLGVGLMYFLDSGRGARRRAMLRDRIAHAMRLTRDAAGATGRDVAQRGAGVAARLRRQRADEPVDDRVLVERVRSRMGRVVSHPHALRVDAADGVVTLTGPILRAELSPLLAAVRNVRGVRQVASQLDVHEHAGDVPSLQGGTTPPGLRSEIWPRQWSPTTRAILGAAAAALAGYGASRRDISGALLTTGGIGLLARAATNHQLRDLMRTGFRR